MIEKWEMFPFFTNEFQNRYIVNLQCSKEDVDSIVHKFGKICQKPFALKSGGFNWSFYIVRSTKEERLDIEKFLRQYAKGMTYKENPEKMRKEAKQEALRRVEAGAEELSNVIDELRQIFKEGEELQEKEQIITPMEEVGEEEKAAPQPVHGEPVQGEPEVKPPPAVEAKPIHGEPAQGKPEEKVPTETEEKLESLLTEFGFGGKPPAEVSPLSALEPAQAPQPSPPPTEKEEKPAHGEPVQGEPVETKEGELKPLEPVGMPEPVQGEPAQGEPVSPPAPSKQPEEKPSLEPQPTGPTPPSPTKAPAEKKKEFLTSGEIILPEEARPQPETPKEVPLPSGEVSLIKVGYFYPHGKQEDLKKFMDTLDKTNKEVVKQSLKIECSFTTPISLDDKLKPEELIKDSQSKNVNLVVFLVPSLLSLSGKNILAGLQEAFRQAKLFLKVIPVKQITKKFTYIDLLMELRNLGQKV